MTNVKTVLELEEALADEEVSHILVYGKLGDETNYNVYHVDRPVIIQGTSGSKVFGTFIVKSNNVTIKDLSIQRTRGTGTLSFILHALLL